MLVSLMRSKQWNCISIIGQSNAWSERTAGRKVITTDEHRQMIT